MHRLGPGSKLHVENIKLHANRRAQERLARDLDKGLVKQILKRITSRFSCRLLEPHTGPKGMYEKWIVYIDDSVPYIVVYWPERFIIVTLWPEEPEQMEIPRKLKRRILNCITSRVMAERVASLSADLERWKVWADRNSSEPIKVLYDKTKGEVIKIEEDTYEIKIAQS